MAKRAKAEDTNGGESAVRSNGYDPEAVKSFVSRVENLNADILAERSASMIRCKSIHEDVRDVLNEAKDAGIPKRALKKVIRARDLERRAGDLRDDLEGEEQDSFDNIRQALGNYSDTPLGAATLKKAAPAEQPTA